MAADPVEQSTPIQQTRNGDSATPLTSTPVLVGTSVDHKKELKMRYPNVHLEGEVQGPSDSRKKKDAARTYNGKVKQLIQISCDEAGRVTRPIEDEPYYHGFMSRNDCEPLLKKDGEFLVRKTEVGGHVHYVMSVKNYKTVHNFLVKRTNKKRLFWVYDYAFKTVSDLIQYHYRNREPICEEGVVLLRPCFKQDWQLNHEQIERFNRLGEGAFGEVFRGTLQISPFMPKQEVAVKTLHTGKISSDERIKFLKEANLMLQLYHPNVVRFHGVATAKEPIMIVMEYCPGGSLLSRVENKEAKFANTVDDRLNYVYGAAKGLKYLEDKKILHRDIAARNCLLGITDDVKISDFGLSLLGNEYREKKLKNVPIRWLAPETLKKAQYSVKTDVYSFSVMVFEVFSKGQVPYDTMENNRELRKLILNQKVKLFPTDPDIPEQMEQMRVRCMQYDPDKRPTFTDIVAEMETMPGIIVTQASIGSSVWQKMAAYFRRYPYNNNNNNN